MGLYCPVMPGGLTKQCSVLNKIGPNGPVTPAIYSTIAIVWTIA